VAGNNDTLAPEAVRSLLDQLLSDSRLYTSGKDYQELIEFVVRLRNFAPFNAMLLHVQKPGLSYAASACDWRERFGRIPKVDARPLIILWPFGPIALVYDVIDTEGKPLPEDVSSFFATGSIDEERLSSFVPLLRKKGIEWTSLDAGDRKAGSVRVIYRAKKKDEDSLYQMRVNKNHTAAIQFVTLTHELAHLFLGHLGPDKKLNIPLRAPLSLMEREIEAESVAFLVCNRNGVQPKSQTYLAGYVDQSVHTDQIDIYQIMRAAGQVEALLNLSAHAKFGASVESRAAESADNSETGGFPPAYFETRFRTDEPINDWPERFTIVTGHATTGEQWTEEVSKAADEKLNAEIKASGRWHQRLTGYSLVTGHAEPGWAVEMSFPDACDLGHRYLQDAIYYIDGDILLTSHCDPQRRRLVQVGASFIERVDG
jgi:Protein of unknown function (DUF3293)